ncbi:hypothetical protein MRX96_009438 [Rhipicephalus microplus]
MGLGLSRRRRRVPVPVREVKWVPNREATPLRTLDELLRYKDEPLLCAVEPLSDAIKRGKPGDPRTIFCHDMDNNYKEDRFIYGSDDASAYRFHHWQIIDTFIYYSHHMVTIPPPGWISAAHRHGVKVLGTFILGKDDIKTINIVRGSGLTSQAAAQLANVARAGRFDGWLVSIGCSMDRSCVPFVKGFLKAITSETHKALPGSLVIWYDAVDVDGKAKPHNELNEKNACFLHLCDGIFLNFRWTEEMLTRSAQLAGDRKADVYVGVDVYARNTSYHGGYEMYKAVELVRRCGLSAAVFAAGWVYETQGKKNFVKNQYRLWTFPDDCCSEWRLTKPPLSTSFCQGFGSRVFEDGTPRQIGHLWFNLHKQQLQPRDQGNSLCGTCCSVKLHCDDAYKGGGCLRVLFKPNPNRPDVKPYVRLFGCDFLLGSLLVSYTFKNVSCVGSVTQDIAVLLKARSAAGELEEIYLAMMAGLPEGDNYTVTREITGTPEDDAEETGTYWMTRTVGGRFDAFIFDHRFRRFLLEDQRGADGAILKEIGLHFFYVEGEANVWLLGQLDVRRPPDVEKASPSAKAAEEATASADSSSDDEPERKRLRDEQYGLDAVLAK